MGEFGPRSLKGVLSTEVRACVTMTHSSTIWIHLHRTGVRKTVLTACCVPVYPAPVSESFEE